MVVADDFAFAVQVKLNSIALLFNNYSLCAVGCTRQYHKPGYVCCVVTIP